MEERIKVIGTGNQAPYGIDETIADYPNTPAGMKKAMRRAAYWYNPAVVIGADSERADINWDIIRPQDRGYVDER